MEIENGTLSLTLVYPKMKTERREIILSCPEIYLQRRRKDKEKDGRGKAERIHGSVQDTNSEGSGEGEDNAGGGVSAIWYIRTFDDSEMVSEIRDRKETRGDGGKEDRDGKQGDRTASTAE